MKRTWITVKRGILEPKHRFALGELVWLFIYILDLANWEEGAIPEWSDKSAAEEMEMPLATLRDQRRKLEAKGYITAERKQHGIRLVIHNWTNPREYTGKKYNVKVPSDTVMGENCEPSLESKDTNHKSNNIQQKNLAKLYTENIGEIYSDYLADAIKQAEIDFPHEWFPLAIEEAVKNNVRKWSYIIAILDDWKINGVKSKLDRGRNNRPEYTGKKSNPQKNIELMNKLLEES